MGGGAALGKGVALVTAVRGSAGAGALRNIGGDGGGSGVKTAADGAASIAGVFIFFDFIEVGVITLHNQLVHIVDIIAVFGGGQQLLSDSFSVFARKIMGQCLPKLLFGNGLILKHTFFYRREGVPQVGDADL